MSNVQFANQVKIVRKTLDISQKQFSVMLGVSDSTIRKWERGESRPINPVTIKKLVEIVNGIH